MKNLHKRWLAAVLCTCMLTAVPKAGAVEIDPEIQAEFDRLIEIEAGDILDQFLNTLPEDVRDALIKAEEEKMGCSHGCHGCRGFARFRYLRCFPELGIVLCRNTDHHRNR